MTRALPLRLQKLVLGALLLVIVALAVGICRVLMSPSDAAVATTPARPAVTPVDPPIRSPARAQALPRDHRAILERPLFDPSRRPPPPSAGKQASPLAKTASPKFPSDKFRLVGIMRSTGNLPQALVRISVNDSGMWIAEGGLVGGWRLAQVGDDKATFMLDDEIGTLKLVPVQAAPEQPATTVPAPPSANNPPPVPAPARTAAPATPAKK